MPFEHVISGNIEALEQGIELLNGMTDEQYQHVAEPYVASSIGAHFRHILDMFRALTDKIADGQFGKSTADESQMLEENVRSLSSFVSSEESGVDCIDYDYRRRGHCVESQRSVALDELRDILKVMHSLRANHSKDLIKADQPLEIKTEVTLNSTHSIFLTSTVLRELIFVSSHAVHHYAVITIIAKLQGIRLVDHMGMAPATVSYLRDLNNSDRENVNRLVSCLLYTSPSPRDRQKSRMPSSA